MTTYCDRCDDTEVLEDGYTCAKCGFVPLPEWGSRTNLYAGIDDPSPKLRSEIVWNSSLILSVLHSFLGSSFNRS